MLLFVLLLLLITIASRILIYPDGHWEYIQPKKRDIDVVEVRIDGMKKHYMYLSYGRSYRKGELILVPFGKGNSTRVATVVKQMLLARDELPVPYEKMKSAGAPLHKDMIRQFENEAP